MTTRERREKHAWRKCVYCGRFISYADFDKGRADSNFWHSYNALAEDVEENFEAFHVACAEKSAVGAKA